MTRALTLRSLAALAGVAVALTACTSNSPSAASGPQPVDSTTGTAASSPAPASSSVVTPSTNASTSAAPIALGKPLHVSSVEADGDVDGVGMPIIVRFSVSPTDKKAFESAAKVTVNGVAATGAWFWEKPYASTPMEVHYRPETYWPAHAKIHVDLPVQNLSAGKGLSFANSLTLDFSIGDYHFSRIDARTLQMKVYNNGKLVRLIPVSLGKSSTPTYSGTKIVMQKDNPVRMQGPGYDELVNYSVRITNSGEYVHYAPWNPAIGSVSTSNGCTNVGHADAIWFYNFAQIGDVLQYPNAPGQVMPSWDGYGDWNLSWSVWQAGGAL